MQIFIDSADPKQIKQAHDWGVIDGVTTNPSLAAKVGKPYKEIIQEILSFVDGPVNLEVIATDYQGMLSQARSLSKLHQNVVVKIPCTQEGIKAIKTLSSEGIKTNVTLVFSAAQALLSAKAGALFCSPFLGRVDDVAEHAGDELIKNIRRIYDHYGFSTKILAASIRDLDHVETVAKLGGDIATIPFDVLAEMVKHPLTDKGLEKFLKDWDEADLELPV